MCLYPQRMVNKKYTVTEKNGGCVPLLPDDRIAYIEVPCGNCYECRSKKGREWKVRLYEEIKEHTYNYFVTLTFEPEKLAELLKQSNRGDEDNVVAALAIRRFLERYRKKYKVSLKHWLISELGQQGTERLHLHGLLMTDTPLEFGEEIQRLKDGSMRKWPLWGYGNIFVGDYVNQKTVNYVIKYTTKIDTDHKGFFGQIFCSPGIGKQWLESREAETYHYRPRESKDYYMCENGQKIALPTYYKNKLYNEKERENIWRDSLDKEQQVIFGTTYDLKNARTFNAIPNILSNARDANKKLDFGDDSVEWRRRKYAITQRMLQKRAREKELLRMMREGIEISEKYKKIKKISLNSWLDEK